MLSITGLSGLGSGQRDQAERAYLDGFAGYAPWAEVSEGGRPDEDALVAVDAEQVAAFLLVRRLTDRRFYLRYLAVAAARRGQGQGSATWPLLLAWARERGAELLVWDVESRHAAGLTTDQRTLRCRRVEFYERLGGVVLPVPDYGNPDEQRPGRAWSAAELLAQHVDGTPVEQVGDPRWRAGVACDVYRHRYDLPADHPRVLALDR